MKDNRIHEVSPGKDHFTITGFTEGKGVACPACGAAHTHACMEDNNMSRMPTNQVHIHRVRAMGYNVC